MYFLNSFQRLILIKGDWTKNTGRVQEQCVLCDVQKIDNSKRSIAGVSDALSNRSWRLQVLDYLVY